MAGLTPKKTPLLAPTPGGYAITTPTRPAQPTFTAAQDAGDGKGPKTGRMTVGADPIGPAKLGQYRGKRVSPSQPSTLRLTQRTVGP